MIEKYFPNSDEILNEILFLRNIITVTKHQKEKEKKIRKATKISERHNLVQQIIYLLTLNASFVSHFLFNALVMSPQLFIECINN
jgi:hypothetical protein